MKLCFIRPSAEEHHELGLLKPRRVYEVRDALAKAFLAATPPAFERAGPKDIAEAAKLEAAERAQAAKVPAAVVPLAEGKE